MLSKTIVAAILVLAVAVYGASFALTGQCPLGCLLQGCSSAGQTASCAACSDCPCPNCPDCPCGCCTPAGCDGGCECCPSGTCCNQ
jgi:hypothetical protein